MAYKTTWNLAVSETQKPLKINDHQHQLIAQVAAGSPADELGLQAGDHLLSVNGRPANQVDLIETAVSTQSINYEFYQNNHQCLLQVSCSNLPLGIKVENPSAAIVGLYQTNGFYGWSDLLKLWERGDWSMLAQAAHAIQGTGFINWLIRKFKPDHGISAEVLMIGAAMYEQGNPLEGINLIDCFINEMINSHTTDYHAVAFYYKALWASENQHQAEFMDWLELANRSNAGRSSRVNQLILSEGSIPLIKEQGWVGQNFPSRFVLPTLGQEGLVALQNLLDGMDEKQLLPLCVMPSYRGNGPYNDSMLCYRATYKHLSHYYKPMVVITDQTEKRADRLWWYENETIARQQHIDFSLVFDETSSVAEKLSMEHTPVFYVLNKQGVIVYEGSLQDPYEYWYALSKRQAFQ